MIFEIGELDKASQGPVWAGFVGDAFHIGAVVVVFIACKEHKRTELDRAQSLGAQLAEGEVRTRSRMSCSKAVTRACFGTAAATRWT